MQPLHRQHSRVCGLWLGLPWCCKALLLLVTCQVFLGASVAVATLQKGCSLSAGSRPLQDACCSSDQNQILASTLVVQLCFGAVILGGLLADCPASQLWSGAAVSCLSGLMWLLFVGVVGNTLHLGSRVAWGLGVVLFTALDLWLLQLSHLQLGWRQHSKLPCDPRRKHAAQQQQLYQARSQYTCLASSCMHILVLSIVNGLVLALSGGRADMAGNSVLTAAAEDPSGQTQAAMQTAKKGVLVSVGFTLLPALWLGASHCAVHFRSKNIELLATATLAVAELFPALQLFFVVNPAYAWPQSLWVQLLLLAAPLGAWMVLLLMTWRSFRAVMGMLRQSWAQELTAKGGDGLTAACDMVHIPDELQPLMQGAWLLKGSIQTSHGPHLAISKANSKQTLSLIAIPSSDTNSVVANNSAAAGANSSGGMLAAGAGRSWQSFLQACSCRQHDRFFQLSVDCITLRWSWNKYVLLYFVDSLSFEPEELRITLRCVLDPDLQLTFPDINSWRQWAAGLHAAMQLLTGLSAHAVPAQEAHNNFGILAGMPDEQPAAGEQHSSSQGAVDNGAGTGARAVAALAGIPAAVQAMSDLQQEIKYGMQLSSASAVAGSQTSSNNLQGASVLQHQLVKAALYGQQGLLPVLGASTSTSSYGAELTAGFAPAASCRMLPALLLPSRRRSQADPSALALRQAQAMAQHIQAAGSSFNLGTRGTTPAECLSAVELQAARPRASAALQDETGADETGAVQVDIAVPHLGSPRQRDSQQLQDEQQQSHVLQESTQLADPAAACDPGVASATAPAAQSTMFGAFRIPAGLQADVVALQLTKARKGQLSSSSSGSGSVHNAGGCSKGTATACSLGTTRSADSGMGWGSGQQAAQGPSVLNAGYCYSPLAPAHSREVQQQAHTTGSHSHAHLPPSKQRQLLLWLQQQSSGSCPESDGPQMSPCYSLDSGQLQPLSAGGTIAADTAQQQLLQLLQQPSTGTPDSAAGGIDPQRGSAIGWQAGQQGCGIHWASHQFLQQGTSRLGVAEAQHADLQRLQIQTGAEGIALPNTLLSFRRSMSLPAVHTGHRCTSTQRSPLANPASAAPKPPADTTGPLTAGTVAAAWDRPTYAEINMASTAHASSEEALTSSTNVTSCSQAEQQTAVSAPLDTQPAPQLSVQTQPGWTLAAAPDGTGVHMSQPVEATLSQHRGTPAAATAQHVCLPVATEASLHQQQPQPRTRQHWGAASFSNIVSAVSSVTRRTRARTTSRAGHADGNEQHKLTNSAAAAGTAVDDGDNNGRSEVAAQCEMQSLDRIGSLKSFIAGAGSSVSFAPAVQESGASFRSMRSVRRVSASFSSRPSFGAARSISTAWRGSFAARSTWSDWDDPASMSQATLDESVGAGRAAGLTVAAAADMPGQQMPQQQQQLGQSPGLVALGSSAQQSAGHQGLSQQQQQQHVQDLPQPAAQEPPASMSMQLAYQLATESASKASHIAAAADIIKPQLHSKTSSGHKEQQSAAHERCPSWLISTDLSPSLTAPSAADVAGSPGNAQRVLNRSRTANLHVVIPGQEAAPSGNQPAFQVQEHARGSQGSHLQVPTPALLLQQQFEPSTAHAAAAGAGGTAMHMPHSASAPHLQHDDSYVVRSPTPSQASLCTRFSHASIASQWWLESCGGCGGSPTSVASLTGRHQGLRPVCDTKPQQQQQQQQGFGTSSPSQPGFCFSVGHGTVASGYSSRDHSQQVSIHETTRLPAAAKHAMAASTAVAAAVHPSVGGGFLHAMDKSPGNGGFMQGESPQVAIEVIEWGSLQLGRRLGQGSEGTVIEARYMDAPVAIKEGAASSEIQMFLAAGVHDNLVGLRGLTRKADGTWCLVLEHCGRGTLDMLIHHSRSPLARAPHPLPPPPPAAAAAGGSHAPQQQQQQQLTRPDVVKLLPLMRGVVRGLVHLHSRKPAILHRDVKPANIMIGHGMQMKVGDLGMARHVLPPSPPAPSKQSAADTPRGSSAAAGSPWQSQGIASGTSTAPTAAGALLQQQGSMPGTPKGPAAAAGVLQQQGSASGTPKGPAAAVAAAGVLLQQGSAPGTPKGPPAVRTFTPGIVGTIMYTAPEVLGVLDEPQQQLSVETVLKADVYSLGVTLWEAVERQRPWQGLDGMQLWTMWVADPDSVTLPPLMVDPAAGDGERDIMSALHALIRDCTQHNPEQRPTMRIVLDRVRHVQKMYEDLRLASVAAAGGPGTLAYAHSSATGSASEVGSLASAAGVESGSKVGSPGVE